MSSRSVSPGGALLRASRVFAIPAPLQRPAGSLSSTAIFDSDTSTLPHPIHQTITTPHASLSRGDWGFKRPLPLRATTRTSTPYLRVKAIDTYEHITEFGPSADHTLTLKKWQEMGIPLSVPVKKDKGGFLPEAEDRATRKSVFEDQFDSTAEVEGQGPRSEDTRWKFQGPWLAGQTEGEFNSYVSTQVRKRKGEFQEFLRKSCANSLTAEARRMSTPDEVPAIVEAKDVTEEQLAEYTKNLREERGALYKLIRSFLDLPPAPSKKLQEQGLSWLTEVTGGRSNKLEFQADAIPPSSSPYAETGPPKTHPSAGLSYSRSSAHIFNHPVWGPQKYRPPVPSRVVMPKQAATGSFAPVLGVGGFVTDVPSGAGADSFNTQGSSAKHKSPSHIIPGLNKIEPHIIGGGKTHVHPVHARVDPMGRVLLTVVPGDPEAVAVLEGTEDQIPPPPMQTKAREPLTITRSTGFRPSTAGSGYGLSYNRQGSSTPATRQTRSPAASRPNAGLMEDLKDIL